MTLSRFQRALLLIVTAVLLIVVVSILVKSQANRTSQPRFNKFINGSLFGSCETYLKKFKTTFRLLKDLNDRMTVYNAYLTCSELRDCFCAELGCSEEFGYSVLRTENDMMNEVGKHTGICCNIIEQASQKFAMSEERWADWIKDSDEPNLSECDIAAIRIM